MNAIDLSILNLKETRRRSIKLWRSLPDSLLSWKPDNEAMTFGDDPSCVECKFPLSFALKERRIDKDRYTYSIR